MAEQYSYPAQDNQLMFLSDSQPSSFNSQVNPGTHTIGIYLRPHHHIHPLPPSFIQPIISPLYDSGYSSAHPISEPSPGISSTSAHVSIQETQVFIPDSVSKQIRPLGQLREVLDTVTGRPRYLMDPLCPSNIDFQRRATDEAAKFFHLVIKHASQRGLKIRYEDPEIREKGKKGIHADPTRILGTSSLDFRWQMKHFQYNRDMYSKQIFHKLISSDLLEVMTQELRTLADSIAHQQNLADNYKDDDESIKYGTKCGTSRQIEKFFMMLNKLVDTMTSCFDKDPIYSDLQIHRSNLHKVYDSYQEFHQFKQVHFNNMSCCERMDRRGKLEKSKLILQILQDNVEEDKGEEWLDLIITRFAAHMNLKISDVM